MDKPTTKRLKQRNYALLIVLLFFAIIFYILSFVRMGAH